MRVVSIILVLVVLLQSCTTLTQSQVAAVNQFALTSCNFSAYPSKIVTGLNDIHVRHRIYFGTSLGGNNAHLNAIEDALSFKVNSASLPAKMDITFRIIDKYAQSLLLLSCDRQVRNIDSISSNFGVGLDSLITIHNGIVPENKFPTGIGSAISELVALGGAQYTRVKQARYIKTFVPQADALIERMTSDLLNMLQGKFFSAALHDSTSIITLINAEKAMARQDYLTFAQQVTPTVENDRDYFKMVEDLHLVQVLYDQTIQATKDMRTAHKQLLDVIKEKRTLKSTVAELQGYYESVNTLRSTFSRISKN